MHRFRPLLFGSLLLSAACVTQAATQCKVVDLMPAYWAALEQPDVSTALHATVIDPHPDLYNANYVDLPADERWRQRLERERTYAATHAAEIKAAERYLVDHVPQFMSEFARQFDDYRCDFTFYIAPSFGMMDGSAASVHGEHRIIFAPDVIPRYHRLEDLKVLIDHETFHIYHHQATGYFGASEEATPSALNALWTEGLATFVSSRMNPAASLDTVMLQPGIPTGAKPHLAEIAKDLATHLDEKDQATFKRYFVAGSQPDGYPPRTGYYIGMLVSQRLSKDHSLSELAHLPQDQARRLIAIELQRLATP